MKHAGPAALDRLADLLARLRLRADLVEKRPGVFYRRGQAFLRFHEDPAGLFADLRSVGDWYLLGRCDACVGKQVFTDRALNPNRNLRTHFP